MPVRTELADDHNLALSRLRGILNA